MITHSRDSAGTASKWIGPGLLVAAMAGLALALAAWEPAAAQSRSNAGVGKAPASPAGAGKKRPARPDLTGLWLNHTRRGAVDIQPCGRPGRPLAGSRARNRRALCGHIVWLKTPNKKNGRPVTDKFNPVRSKRRRKVCGLQVIANAKRISRRVYDNGRIYDPERGKEGNVELTLLSNNILQVKGYLGFKFLNETYLWRRAPAKLEQELCANTPATARPKGKGAPPTLVPPRPSRAPARQKN